MDGSAGSATLKITPSSAESTKIISEIASISMDSNRCLNIISTPPYTQRCSRNDTQTLSTRIIRVRRLTVFHLKLSYLSIYQEATDIYGLIHARFIITQKGLTIMRDKYIKGVFGVCPRVLCERQHVLPIGMS